MIFIQISQVVIAPTPGQVTGFVSGYTFGAFWGSLYTIIGTMIGSFIVFVIARKFGRALVEKFVKPKTLSKIDTIVNDGGMFALFILWLLPVVPDDAICFGAGLTKIRIKALMFIATLGRLPGVVVLNMVGAGIATHNADISLIILVVIAVVSLLIFRYKKQLEALAIKLTKKV